MHLVQQSTQQAPPEPRLREILGGAAAVRVLVLIWSLTVTIIDSRSSLLTHPLPAFAGLAAIAGWTGLIGLWVQSDPARLLRLSTQCIDLAFAASLVAADWYLYSGGHPQSFGSAWPATVVVSTAAINGWRVGAGAGIGLGLVNVVAAAFVGRLDGRGLALSGSVVLLATVGAVAGYVVDRLRRADSEVAEAQARENFARTLHDGVLQSLAVIQRRSSDAELVDLAREQEAELRHFIGGGGPEHDGLIDRLRAAAVRIERHHDMRVSLVIIDAPQRGPAGEVGLAGDAAIASAAIEAVTNAAKHSQGSVITVCIDQRDGGTMVSVNDDGKGFDPATATMGDGFKRSIQGRIEEIGGTVTVRSKPGRGTEVELWIP